MRHFLKLFAILGVCAALNMGMARRGQYDEEARQMEKMQKEYEKAGYTQETAGNEDSLTDVASGVKQATYDSTAGLLKDTAEGTAEAPVTGTVKGVVKGSGKVLENTSKGVAEVITLGRADSSSFRVEDPEHGSKEDTTKVKFNF